MTLLLHISQLENQMQIVKKKRGKRKGNLCETALDKERKREREMDRQRVFERETKRREKGKDKDKEN